MHVSFISQTDKCYIFAIFYHVESGLHLESNFWLELKGLGMGLIRVLVELDLDLEIVDFVLDVTVFGLDRNSIAV